MNQDMLAIIFYSVIILLIIIFRKKFEMHGILALYRTKIGLPLMEKWSKKYREILRLLGYIGIGASYIGLIFITLYLFKNIYTVIFQPDAPLAVSPVLPGVKVPGTDFRIPLIGGWIALFIVVLVHEFAHGVIGRVHDLKIKSSGIFFLGPLMGAFVEPEEKNLRKAEDTKQYSVYAAGPFANLLLAVVAMVLFSFVVNPAYGAMVDTLGFEVGSVMDDYPAQAAGLEAGMNIIAVNDNTITDHYTFTQELGYVQAGETVKITTDEGEFAVVTTEHPDDARAAYLGVMGGTKMVLKSDTAFNQGLLKFLGWLSGFLSLLAALSIGIGLINLFPIFITDGARMLQVSLVRMKGEEKGFHWWKHANVLCLTVLILSLLIPFYRWLISLI